MAEPLGEPALSLSPSSSSAATCGASLSGWSLTLNVLRTPPFRATSTLTTSPGLAEPDDLLELADVLDRLAVHRDDDVARLDAGGLGRRVVAGDVLDHDAADLGQADIGGIVQGHVVDRDAQRRAVDLAVL